MFPPNQRSKPIFRKNAEHYIAYNALHVIYHDTISCNIYIYIYIYIIYSHDIVLDNIQAKMQICLISEQTAIIWPQKKW